MSDSKADKAATREVLDIESPLELKLSPDCKSIVYITRLKWYHQTGSGPRRSSPIWIADVDITKSARHLTDGLHNDRIPQWSPQGHAIAFLSDRANDSGKSIALYLLDLDATEPIPITPVENGSAIPKFAFSPDGQAVAYMATDEETEEAKSRKESTGGASVWMYTAPPSPSWTLHRTRLTSLLTSRGGFQT
ncbi:Alpha/Beta hydrolase protein [Apiospora phragmitis]|uniref:Alpha/Beta hydrolase protein n=1 Tax=Apiospora phragmitis TaxID=2905665 RepID=A0ABR1TBC0_9PEZI